MRIQPRRANSVSTNEPFYSRLGDDLDVAELVEMFVDGLPQRLRQLEVE